MEEAEKLINKFVSQLNLKESKEKSHLKSGPAVFNGNVDVITNGTLHSEEQTEEIDLLENAPGVNNAPKLALSLQSLQLSCVPDSLLQVESLKEIYLDYNELEEIPETIGTALPNLEILSANGNNLTDLPETLGCLSKLQKLEVSENELIRLPASVVKLKHLKSIKVIGNELKELPQNFGNLKCLENLYADENELTDLPNSVCSLNNLKVLELSNNRLRHVPTEIGSLRNLVVLNISSNKVDFLPESMGDLAALEELDLSGNTISFLPSKFKSAPVLRKLYVDNNVIKDFPGWCNELPSIQEFSIKDNQLHNNPLQELFGFKNTKLKYLNFGGNFIRKLPDSFGQLEQLEYLHFGSIIPELERRNFQNGNWLYELPKSFGCLVKLRELHLDENQLSELPDNFGMLVNLEFLDLGQNLIHQLPESFGNLRSLRICQLSKNHLQLLPSSFGNLTSLEELKLDNNQIAELPESFNKLTQLITLDLFNNFLTEIPEALGYLSNLTRLDMSKNKFPLEFEEEVPEIFNKRSYAPRDESKIDNWRGRSRLQRLQVKNSDIIRISEEDIEHIYEPPPEVPYSSYVLQAAMRRNLSLWKSHTDEEGKEREVFQRPPPRRYNLYSCFESEDEENDDDWEAPADSCDGGSGGSSLTVSNSAADDSCQPIANSLSCEEDWDKELTDIHPYYDAPPVYQHPTTRSPQGISPVEHVFDNLHPTSVWRLLPSPPPVEGQFDDADE